jgi:predicted  nucleic acid-binding Zn-ribbon protein
MEAVRDVWTDERLDDLNHRVDEGFREMREEFRAIRLESKTEFASVREEFRAIRGESKAEFASVRGEIGGVREEIGGVREEIASVREEIGGVRGEIAALHRTMIQLFGGLMATLVIGFAGLITTQL